MYKKQLTTAIAVCVALVIIGLFFYNRSSMIPGDKKSNTASTQNVPGNVAEATTSTLKQIALNPKYSPSGLGVQEEVVGTGKEAKLGSRVTVHYIGILTTGQKFDSSRDRNTPFVFTIGKGEVIKGWDEGVTGMKVGGKRILVVPPELGYGAKALGPIPANSILLFEVELLDVN